MKTERAVKRLFALAPDAIIIASGALAVYLSDVAGRHWKVVGGLFIVGVVLHRYPSEDRAQAISRYVLASTAALFVCVSIVTNFSFFAYIACIVALVFSLWRSNLP